MDEMAEFPPSVLDALRTPLEEGVVRVSRARASVTFPARFLLVGAMNPCPCGEGGPLGSCHCSDVARLRYVRRLSGPLLDRFDLRIAVGRPDVGELLGGLPGESSSLVAARVVGAREAARARGVRCNAELPGPQLETEVRLTAAAARILEHKLRTGTLTARGLHRVKRVARTVADLCGCDRVDDEHVCTAIELRADRSMLQAIAS